MGLPELDHHEKLALGGLIRILIRLDGSFSEEEEERLNELGEELGDADALFRLLDESAQALSTDEEIRKAAQSVARPAARQTIYEALVAVAEAGTITEAEGDLLEWVADIWELSDDDLEEA